MNHIDNVNINTNNNDDSGIAGLQSEQARKTSTGSQINTSSTSSDWSSTAFFNDNASTGSSSTQLVSPISNTSDSFNMLSGEFPIFGNAVNPAYGYSTQQPSSSGSNASFNYPFYTNQSTGTDFSNGINQKNGMSPTGD